MNSRTICGSMALATALVAAPAAHATTLTTEPVFNRVAGTGPSETTLGFYIPGLINPATGQPFLTADEPGETVVYPGGFPADPGLVEVVRFYNNTEYVITGFILSLIGTADEPSPFNFTITPDPNVNAFFGDANGDGQVGRSDIFTSIVVSNGGRTITFSGGEIAPGERFTDFLFSSTDDGQPFNAAWEASFTGYRVPEPGTLGLLGLGLAGAIVLRRGRT